MPWEFVVVACLTLGLAPFAPPHIVEKLQMLFKGTLKRPIDVFDLLMHGIPWVILIAKAALTLRK
ncbi:MAG: RND transporter [Deltaproteobacteria bacterium]|nr:RND transporter [Deltaproteobacteria bacterium]